MYDYVIDEVIIIRGLEEGQVFMGRVDYGVGLERRILGESGVYQKYSYVNEIINSFELWYYCFCME